MIMSDKKIKNEIDWIGSIPHGWASNKAKYLFALRTSKGNIFNLKLLTPSQIYGVIPQEEYEMLSSFKTVKLKEGTDLKQFRTVHKGDFCISLRSFQGGFEFSTYEGVVSPAYQIFYPVKKVCGRYYKYLFKIEPFINKINSLTLSLRDGKNISFFDFGNIRIPTPKLEVQEKIANFLDSKCSEIDSLVADIQKEISILEEYKKSVITESVTKGIVQNVEMKNSGINWIGKIPKTWTISRLKFLLKEKMKYGASETGVDYSAELPRYVRITDILPNNKLKEENKLSLTKEQSKGFILEDGTVLFARSGGTVGKTFLYNSQMGVATYAGYLISAIANSCVLLPEWLFYFSLSSSYLTWVELIFSQSTIQNINADKYSNMPLTLPPIEEQKSICSFLKKACSEIDNAISEKQSQLEILAEYKKSLIYEYVTGKKEVI